MTGLPVPQIGSYLSSFPNVVRADKARWGLAEWIDDEYEGIEAEIIQRIDEGGGVTSTKRLLDELPRKFGVTTGSVNAYLQSPKFTVERGHVTLATAPTRPDPPDSHRVLPDLPTEWKIQTKLRCGSLCGFSLSHRIGHGLLQLRDLSLLELYFYLEHRIHNAQLADLLKTDYDQRLVRHAYAQFHELLLKSRRNGRISQNKLEWIVPYDYTNSRSDIDPAHAAAVERILEHSFAPPDLSSIAADLWEWLPWMPLSVVKHLRTWRAPRINAVQRALFKLVGDVDNTTNAFYPWEPGFNPETRSIPIQALFQYEPTSLTRGALDALRDCGLASVSDLRCLHPDAILAAKNSEQPLLRIYRSLHSAR